MRKLWFFYSKQSSYKVTYFLRLSISMHLDCLHADASMLSKPKLNNSNWTCSTQVMKVGFPRNLRCQSGSVRHTPGAFFFSRAVPFYGTVHFRYNCCGAFWASAAAGAQRSLLLDAFISLHTFATVIGGRGHLLLGVVLAFIIMLLVEVLLFGVLHLLHGTAVLGLLVDWLHVMSWSEHLVPTHTASTCAHRTFLTFPFAFFATALVQGSIQL